MKCPKCSYLGFETGDRCKNCGYDFSLLTAEAAPPDLPLREPESVTSASSLAWLDHFDRDRDSPSTYPVVPAATSPQPFEDDIAAPVVAAEPTPPPVEPRRPRLGDSALPLFNPPTDDDDAPLIKLPAAPRPPLAVRRTPDAPRLRAVSKSSRRSGTGAVPNAAEPVLAFVDEPVASEPEAHGPVAPARARRVTTGETSSPGRRLTAAAIDHAILFGVDAIVIYFTLRLAAMAMADWPLLPAVPMLVFLGLVKAAYFCAFTAVGGQTIGKMAARIRVIADDNTELDPPQAIRRTAAGAISLLTLGLGFLPALVTADRRALHDRLAGTRVIAVH